MSIYEKDFDAILDEILTTYSNLDSQPDISIGSSAWIMASVLTEIVWGLYKYQDYISLQHFPDTCDTDNLNHWGSVYNISRNSGESDESYRDRILTYIRQAPAGGNALDYETWALDRTNVSYAYTADATYYVNYATVESNPDDIMGTVGIYVIPTDETAWQGTGDEAAIRAGIQTAAQSYIDTVKPLGVLSAGVYDTTRQSETIDIDVWPETDSTVNTVDMSTAIYNYMYTLKPGETLYQSSLYHLAVNYGADHATINSPASDTSTDSNYYYIRPDTITITYNES